MTNISFRLYIPQYFLSKMAPKTPATSISPTSISFIWGKNPSKVRASAVPGRPSEAQATTSRHQRSALSPPRRVCLSLFYCRANPSSFTPLVDTRSILGTSGPRGAGALSRPGFICIFISPISSSWPRFPSPGRFGSARPCERWAVHFLSIFIHLFFSEWHAWFQKGN